MCSVLGVRAQRALVAAARCPLAALRTRTLSAATAGSSLGAGASGRGGSRRALATAAAAQPPPLDPGPFQRAPFSSLRLDLTAPPASPAAAALQRDPADLPAFLAASLPAWRAAGVNAVFLTLALPAHGALVSALVGPRGGFAFHHARGCTATLFAWLPQHTPCKVPPYAGTQVAVGGVCVDGAGRLLLIRERHAPQGAWKFPGGMSEPGEDLPRCAVREVWEETGVRTRFEGLLGLRHMHGAAFGVSDIYFLALLRPLAAGSATAAELDAEVRPDPGEVAECAWRDGGGFAAATPHALMARAARDGLAAASARGWLSAAPAAAAPALAGAAPPLLHLSPVFSPASKKWTQCYLGGEGAVEAVPRGLDRGAVPAQPEAPPPWELAGGRGGAA